MLHFREVGQGSPVILLLHAFPLNWRMWEPQIDGLRDRARIIAPDFPGFGLSGPPQGMTSLEDYARKVVAMLDRQGVDEVVVAGLSMGGYVAFRLIELLGGRLAGLLLADTRTTADDAETATARHELAAEVEAQGVEVAANEFLPKLIGRTTLRTRPALVDSIRSIIIQNNPAGVAAGLRALAARSDSTSLLAHVACPVVCVAGQEDSITPPETAADMAARIPGAKIEVLAGAGHLSNMEAPEAFTDVLKALLAESRGR
jgi:pimeloyl-ACP methyl ester carboxylesterase